MDGIGSAAERVRRRNAVPWFLGPAVTLFALLFVVLGAGMVYDGYRLVDHGVMTEGRIVEKDVDRSTDSGDVYSLVYAFTDGAGRPAVGRGQVPYRTYVSTRVGSVVAITYLPEAPAVSRLGKPELQWFPASFALALGLTFVVVGFGLTLTWMSQRRRRPDRVGGLPSHVGGSGDGILPEPVRGTYRFERSPIRVAVDLVGPLGGGASFLVVALWMAANVVASPMFVIGAVGFGLFGALMLAGAPVTLRRGLRRAILEISPDGLWTPESGLLRWSEIREVRLEDPSLASSSTGAAGSVAPSAGYARLGIVPLDPERAARAPGGVARGVGRVLTAFARLGSFGRGPGPRGEAASLAPFGVYEFELDVPLAAIVPLIAPRARVVDASGAFVRPEDEERWAARPS